MRPRHCCRGSPPGIYITPSGYYSFNEAPALLPGKSQGRIELPVAYFELQ